MRFFSTPLLAPWPKADTGWGTSGSRLDSRRWGVAVHRVTRRGAIRPLIRPDPDCLFPCRPLRLLGSLRLAVAEYPNSIRIYDVVTVACGALESVRINDLDSATSLFDEL
jgi:hypothetical protein